MSLTFLELVWVLAIGAGFTSVLIAQRTEHIPEEVLNYCEVDLETQRRLRDEAFLFGQSQVKIDESMRCDGEN